MRARWREQEQVLIFFICIAFISTMAAIFEFIIIPLCTDDALVNKFKNYQSINQSAVCFVILKRKLWFSLNSGAYCN